MAREERETADRREKASKKENSWALLRLCKNYIKENTRSWKNNMEVRGEERREEIEKNERLKKVAKKKTGKNNQ